MSECFTGFILHLLIHHTVKGFARLRGSSKLVPGGSHCWFSSSLPLPLSLAFLSRCVAGRTFKERRFCFRGCVIKCSPEEECAVDRSTTLSTNPVPQTCGSGKATPAGK